MRALNIVVLLVALVGIAIGTLAFLREGGGRPNALLPGGVGSLTGMIFDPQLRALREPQRAQALRDIDNPVRYINLELRPHESNGVRIYLLGDTAPLYYLGAAATPRDPRFGHVLYHTTWDTSPLGDAIGEHPDEPRKWSAHLHAIGFTHVLINLDELARLVDRNKYFDPRVAPEIVTRWITAPDSGLVRERDWPRVNAEGRRAGGHLLLSIEPVPSGRNDSPP